jgi:FkbM family methyltransferase
MKMKKRTELHPNLRCRLARCLRWGANLRGWGRTMSAIAGTKMVDPTFRVRNNDGWFEGSMDSALERFVYLFGSYEAPLLDALLAKIPLERRDTFLDIGANMGTHSIAMAKSFSQVIAFEPNPTVSAKCRKNIALNGLDNIQLIECGLSDEEGTFDFYLTEKDNEGLGTFSSAEQYDVPLVKVGEFAVKVGDKVLQDVNFGRIDGIKIDVQGLELNVLRGLRKTLEANRPLVWLELGAATQEEMKEHPFADHFPYPVSYFAFSTEGRFRQVTRLRPITQVERLLGDVLIVPSNLS